MADETQTATPSNDPVQVALERLKNNIPQGTLLSSVAGPAPAKGEMAAYVPPTYASRTEARQLIHDRALKDIVRLRFGFPTEKYRDFKTHVNHPARSMGIELGGGLVAYPDIVVVQHPENNARIV